MTQEYEDKLIRAKNGNINEKLAHGTEITLSNSTFTSGVTEVGPSEKNRKTISHRFILRCQRFKQV